MKSPFPGMDPYLERHWRDLHATLIVLARGAIQRQLGGGLRARIEERLVVEAPSGDSVEMYPDVRVIERGIADHPVAPTAAGVVIAEPLIVSRPAPVTQRHIEVIDTASGGRVITVIEFVSPSNKLAGDAREKYLQKSEQLVDAGVNLVEIDLTRTGRRSTAYPVANLSPEYRRSAYLACVYRGHGFNRFEIYAMPLRQRLPALRIPLRPEDSDAVLDLQAVLDQAYEEARFDDVDYSQPPQPVLDPDDAAWAAELLKQHRTRG